MAKSRDFPGLPGRAVPSPKKARKAASAPKKASPSPKKAQKAAPMSKKAAKRARKLDTRRLTVPCPSCSETFHTAAAQHVHARDTGHEPLMSKELRNLLRRNGPECTWCGHPVILGLGPKHDLSPTREHMVPKSVGGGRGDNLEVAHVLCNRLRGVMEADAFRRLMRGEAVTCEDMWPHLFAGIREIGRSPGAPNAIQCSSELMNEGQDDEPTPGPAERPPERRARRPRRRGARS